MRAALIYISEYAETKRMMTEGRYNNEELLVRLRAVFGHVDQVRDHIDKALQQDNAHRRKRDMRFLILPTRFPRPESMGQGDIAVWTNWIHEEMNEIMKQLEEKGIPEVTPMTHSMVLRMVSSYRCRIHYHYPLQYKHQNDKKITARVQNLLKILGKTSEDRI